MQNVVEIAHGVLIQVAELQLLQVSQELLVLIIDGIVHNWVAQNLILLTINRNAIISHWILWLRWTWWLNCLLLNLILVLLPRVIPNFTIGLLSLWVSLILLVSAWR